MTNDPSNPEYNAKARDAIMDLCPFYDPNHKCGIVREPVFKGCLNELRERNRLLEAECTRLHSRWHAAEERSNEARAAYEAETRSTAEMVKICATITGHAPRELCTTAEAVEWLVDRHKAATAALYKLEEIRTDKLAQAGFSEEPTAICAARHLLLKSQREAAESADEKPDGQAENSVLSQPRSADNPK